MTPSLKKRFWKQTTVIQKEDGFTVTLDGHELRTPAKAKMRVPSKRFATAIAHEWDAQQGEIDPSKMPATRAANAAIDKVATNKSAVIEMLVEYGDTDLLLYRANSPAKLVERQAQSWDSLVDWVQNRFDLRLNTTSGIMPVSQPPESLSKYNTYLNGFSDFQLTGLHDLITVSGSFIIGAATAENHLTPEAAWQVARLDEEWQIEQWGEDEEASKEADRKKADFFFAHVMLTYC